MTKENKYSDTQVPHFFHSYGSKSIFGALMVQLYLKVLKNLYKIFHSGKFRKLLIKNKIIAILLHLAFLDTVGR